MRRGRPPAPAGRAGRAPRVERRAELGERDAEREVRRRRREEVAAVERPRDRLERVLGVRELVRRRRSRRARRPRAAAGRCRGRRRAARRRVRSASGRRWLPTPGSTTARWTPSGMYGSVFASTSAPWSTCCGGIPCVMSMISRVGRDPLDHAVARADEVVLQPEVGQEGDDHGREPKAPLRTRLRRDESRRGRASPPRRRRATPAARARARVVCGPIETAGSVEPSAAKRPRRRGGGEHDEVAVGRRLGPELARAVERRRSRRRARRRAAAARPRRRRRARGRPAAGARRAGPPASRRAGTSAGSTPPRERLGRARADRRDARQRAASAAQQLAAPFGLVTTTQS